MFGTHEGRVQLATQSGFARLVVIHFVRGQEYPSMEVVQEEISQNVSFVMPASVEGNPNVKVNIRLISVWYGYGLISFMFPKKNSNLS
jgi:hypothetical protein